MKIFGLKIEKVYSDGRMSKVRFLYLDHNEFKKSKVFTLPWRQLDYLDPKYENLLFEYFEHFVDDLDTINYITENYTLEPDETYIFNAKFTQDIKLNLD